MMDTSQKLSLSAFLCLSLAMIIVTLIRFIGTLTNKNFRMHSGMSVIWPIYWHLLEGCVAVITASVIVIRSVFIQRDPSEVRERSGPSFSWLRAKMKLSSSSSGEHTDEGGSRRRSIRGLPSLLTGATLKGLTNFMGGRSVAEPSRALSPANSKVELTVLDYHTIRRLEVESQGVSV